MPYNGPVWQSMAGADKRGEIYLQAGQNFGQAVGAGIAKLGDNIKELVDKREEADARKGTYEVFRKQYPGLAQSFDDKFYSGSAGTQRGIISQMIAWAARDDQQTDRDRRFGLETAKAANQASYMQAQVDNMAADNSRQERKLNADLLPDNQVPVVTDIPGENGSPGATALGVTSEKSGTKYFQFIPKPKTNQFKPGLVTGPDGVGYYQDANGKVVPKSDLMYVQPSQEGAPASGQSSDLLPAGKPFTTRPQPLVPLRTQIPKTENAKVWIQEADGSISLMDSKMRTWPDGRTEIFRYPNQANAAAGQNPEWVDIGGGERPYDPATDLLPPPDAITPAPGSPRPPATPAAPAAPTGTTAPRRWR